MQSKKGVFREVATATEAQVSSVGTWRLQVTFQNGLMQGQTVEGKIVLEPDARQTCISLVPHTGAGNWGTRQHSQGPNDFFFDFTEVLYDSHGNFTDYVSVSQNATLSTDGNSFTSSGTGNVYSAGGTLIATNETTIKATRLS
jgi:hypothetical protein